MLRGNSRRYSHASEFLDQQITFRDGQFSKASNTLIRNRRFRIAYRAHAEVDAPTGKALTSINIDSAAGIFTGDAAQNLGGSFDNHSDTNLFKATFGSSFASIDFSSVAQPGLSEEFSASDLTIVGSLAVVLCPCQFNAAGRSQDGDCAPCEIIT